MSGECVAFEMKDIKAAWEHMDLEAINDYGNYAYGHYFYTWDDGKKCWQDAEPAADIF